MFPNPGVEHSADIEKLNAILRSADSDTVSTLNLEIAAFPVHAAKACYESYLDILPLMPGSLTVSSL